MMFGLLMLMLTLGSSFRNTKYQIPTASSHPPRFSAKAPAWLGPCVAHLLGGPVLS